MGRRMYTVIELSPSSKIAFGEIEKFGGGREGRTPIPMRIHGTLGLIIRGIAN